MKEIGVRVEDFDHPYDLIKSINPGIPPEQAVAQVEAFNKWEFNKTQVPVEEARNELLRRAGYNPKDWTFYSNTLRSEGQSDEDMLRSLARPFPDGIEFLVIQGEFLGGVSGTPGKGSWGWARYKYYPNGYTAFIRARPKPLKGG